MAVSKTRIAHLPYFPDSSLLFAPLAGQAWAMFLDSGYPHSKQGRYDIIVAQPVCCLETFGQITRISSDGTWLESHENPFTLVKQHLHRLALSSENEANLPFIGGALGYFGYDLARRLENLPALRADNGNIADMAIGIYRWALVVDHQQQRSYLVEQGIAEAQWQHLISQFSHLPAPTSQSNFQVTSPVGVNMQRQEYEQALTRIKHYLTEGDCYQINFSQCFQASCQGDAWQAYQTLRAINAAPFSAYLNLATLQVLSSSPERFLKVQQGGVETKPIKGTRPRKTEPLADEQQQQLLQTSSKDRAENVMIVDLLRNDLSKTCTHVRVPALFAIESYATVHHLVSTVTGELKAGKDALDVLQSCFPGGSITGAPKIRAMEIIEELEPQRRGVYCGAIGYISFDGSMDTNIAIRTLVHEQGVIRFWAGGGIVNDSVIAEEYQECFDKASALLRLLAMFSSCASLS